MAPSETAASVRNDALVVYPSDSRPVSVLDVGPPAPEDGDVLIETLEVGVCGTDADIIAKKFGAAPSGREHLVLGHEVLGRVLSSADDSAMRAGDLVTVAVRQPGPDPCAACLAGDYDMCRDGGFTEYGILGLDGFARSRFRAPSAQVFVVPELLRTTGVLIEPASIVAKAWHTIDRVAAPYLWLPRRVLITGAGPIGLLAALLSRQRGYDTTVLDRNRGKKADLIAEIGAHAHHGGAAELPGAFDVIIECTGDPSIVAAVIRHSPAAVIGLLGLSYEEGICLDVSWLTSSLLHHNGVLFGSVNAGREHYLAAIEALSAAPAQWLRSLVTRRVPLHEFSDLFPRRKGDVKVVLDFTAAAGAGLR